MKLKMGNIKEKAKLYPDVLKFTEELFNTKGWIIEASNNSMFNRYCSRLSMLSKGQQLLVLDISRRFNIINGQDYLSIFFDIFNNNELLNNGDVVCCNKYYVFPLIAPKDIGKSKSSTFLHYFLKSSEVRYKGFFENKELVFCEINNIDWVKNINEKEKIILVDDYIGSGETAIEAVQVFLDNDILNSKLVVIALAAQEIGINNLRKADIKVYTNKIYKRGISDYYLEDELEDAILTMKDIEKKLKVTENYKFGYAKSEALISMNRTPNNTFPVFWFQKNRESLAPFPR